MGLFIEKGGFVWQMKDLIVKKDFPPGGQMNTFVSFYISKSKAGEQYLDSLGGNNRIDKEAINTKNFWLIRLEHMREDCYE